MDHSIFTAEEASKLPLYKGCTVYINVHCGGMPTVRAVEVSDVAFECFVSRVRIEYINHRFRTIDNGYLNHTVFLTYQDAAKHACHDYVKEIERLEQQLETKKKKLAELMASIEKNEVPVS